MCIRDSGVSHEIVRHRLAAYCQESTRYCNYSKDGFGNEITVIEPCFFHDQHSDQDWENYQKWEAAMADAEAWYMELLQNGACLLYTSGSRRDYGCSSGKADQP